MNAGNEDQGNSKKRKADDSEIDTGNKRVAATDESKKSKIYIRGLPWRATEDEVRDYFASCGTINSVELPLNKDGRSSGTGKSCLVLYSKILGIQNRQKSILYKLIRVHFPTIVICCCLL